MEKCNITPPVCPRCKSMKRGKKEGSRIIPLGSSQIVNGVQCNAIRFSYVTCLNCRQRYVVREPIEIEKK